MCEHGTVCPLCDETLHEGELCDDANCPLGGSVKVVRNSIPFHDLEYVDPRLYNQLI